MKTNIEWSEHVWNPLAGCSKVSPGCANCYAERMAKRLQAMGVRGYEGVINERGHWTGRVNMIEEALTIPLKRKKPTMFFVNSMSDLFHESVPFEFIDMVFGAMALCPQHIFQVLTKRPERMRDYFGPSAELKGMMRDCLVEGTVQNLYEKITGEDPSLWLAAHWPFPNVWLGVSVENQEQADKRIPILLQCPAAERWVSAEPLLGHLDIDRLLMKECPSCRFVSHHPYCPLCKQERIPGIRWVVTGGESGPGARACDIQWIRDIRNQCWAAGVPCFIKQDSGPRPGMQGRIPDDLWSVKEFPREFPEVKCQ